MGGMSGFDTDEILLTKINNYWFPCCVLSKTFLGRTEKTYGKP